MNLPHAFADDDGLEQPKVLLVDDDEVNLLLTAIALRERGFSITEVGSGADALTASRPAASCAACPGSRTCRC